MAATSVLAEIRQVETVRLNLGGVEVTCLVVRLNDQRAYLIPIPPIQASNAKPLAGQQLLRMPSGADFAVDGRMDLACFTGALMASAAITNRRGAFRIIRPEIRAEFSLDDVHWSHAAVEDLSEGGTCLSLDCAALVGMAQRVFVRLHLTQDDTISCEGAVRRCLDKSSVVHGERKQLGIQFTRMAPDSKQRLMHYIFQYQMMQARARSGV